VCVCALVALCFKLFTHLCSTTPFSAHSCVGVLVFVYVCACVCACVQFHRCVGICVCVTYLSLASSCSRCWCTCVQLNPFQVTAARQASTHELSRVREEVQATEIKLGDARNALEEVGFFCV